MKDIRKLRKQQGLCTCGRVMDREGYSCTKCNNRLSEWKLARQRKLHVEGKCSGCAKDLDRAGWTCIECGKIAKARARARDAERKANGLCTQCNSPTDGTAQCRRCLDALKERRNNKNKSSVKKDFCTEQLWFKNEKLDGCYCALDGTECTYLQVKGIGCKNKRTRRK